MSEGFGRQEARAKYDKLIEDLYAAHQSRQIGQPLNPRVTKNLFSALIQVYLRGLNQSEINHIEAWGVPWEGWPNERGGPGDE